MNTLKVSLTIVAFLCAGMAKAGVSYTNNTDSDQVVTIFEQDYYSYYGLDNWSYSNTFTQTVSPGDTVGYDDYYTTEGDGGSFSQTFDLVSVASAESDSE